MSLPSRRDAGTDAAGPERPLPARGSGTPLLLRSPLLRPILRGVDALYMAFQVALKSFGLVSLDDLRAPEESGPRGRFALLPRRAGRWPELRIRLPSSAVYRFSAESMFRRAGTWFALADRHEVIRECRAAAHEAWPEVREEPGEPVHVFSFEGGGVTHRIRVSEANGMTLVGVGQKLGRLRFAEAERLLEEGARRAGPRPRGRSPS